VAAVAVRQPVAGFKCRFNFELTNRCVRTEIPVYQRFNLLNGTHRLSPNSDTKTVEQCFNHLENILTLIRSFRVIALGEFHVSDYVSGMGFPQTNSNCYTKIIGVIFISLVAIPAVVNTATLL
jgi:hypothetical protein